MLRKKENNYKDNCKFCKDAIPHMFVTMDKGTGEIHVHAPFNNKYLMVEFMGAIQKEWDRNSIDQGLNSI